MTDFKEEAYVLEKMEISEDEDDGFEYKEIKNSDIEGLDELEESAGVMDGSLIDDEDDLNDFNTLKKKTELKKLTQFTKDGGERAAKISQAIPKTVQRDVVIDDFIRNFMQKFNMTKTLNVFQ